MARIPLYRRRERAKGDVAYVEIGGKRRTLPGRYNSPESKEAYAALVRDLARSPEIEIIGTARIDELVGAYWDHAETYYSRKEYLAIKSASQPLLDSCANLPVDEFGARGLERVRVRMIDNGWSRPTINHHVNRLRRLFRWGVARDMVHGSVLQSMLALPPLKAGRTTAPEPPKVPPVDWAVAKKVLPHCSPVLAAMLELQYLTGMRSQNLTEIRPADIDRSRKVWRYVPRRHKTSWRQKNLCIFLGPRCQAILKPYLDRKPDEFCFSPSESEAWRYENRPVHTGRGRKGTNEPGRKTKQYPSEVARLEREKAARRKRRATLANRHYTTDTYRQSLDYAIERAGIPHFHPHQFRHTRGTEVRARYGLEAAQVFLGHSHATVTEIYAERDFAAAESVAAEMG